MNEKKIRSALHERSHLRSLGAPLPCAALSILTLFGSVFAQLVCPPTASAQTAALEQQLMDEEPDDLAADARELGDRSRGAFLFHSPGVGCAKCHVATKVVEAGAAETSRDNALGPDLASWKRSVDDRHLIESVLQPSAKIEPDYQSIQVITVDGRPIVGIEVSRNETALTLRTGVGVGDLISIDLEDIDVEKRSDVSLMPTGQVNAFRRRQDFLDLLAYLIAIRDGGRTVAEALQPSQESLRQNIPAYESDLDHSGMIADWNDKSFQRGEAIYQRVCQNCHGTLDQPGSLPTSLRFAEGKFKFGSDPHAMYQTLTFGGGMMVPQTWMVPQQKYDVIHYIREHFLRGHNSDQYFAVDQAYLASLPGGASRGPEPQVIEPWVTMDYGSMLITTIQFGENTDNLAQKAIAIRVDDGPGGVSRGKAWMVFEHDTLRMAAAWTGEFVDWNGIQFNGRHGVHLRASGDIVASSRTGPGWAEPETGSIEDHARVVGRDDRRYGPLPPTWGKFRGLYRYENQVVLRYTIGSTNVLERPASFPLQGETAFVRTLNVGVRKQSLDMVVSTLGNQTTVENMEAGPGMDCLVVTEGDKQVTITTDGFQGQASLLRRDNQIVLRIEAGGRPIRGSVILSRAAWDTTSASVIERHLKRLGQDLEPFTRGGPPQYAMEVEVAPRRWFESEAWRVDELARPETNPWLARTRVTGLDFSPDGKSLVACTWDGDVWRVNGLDTIGLDDGLLRWRRIASGLFQPLGILWEDDRLMVTCRDQLVALRDLNRDGEMDDYECFNSDHQVTEHFHEFAMGLQRDAEGNYYYAKSARHALTAVVPHHGTLLRVSSDGGRTDILAKGFRAANGVCLNDDGSFIVTDQEGHWNPKNRINWVRPGGFYGNMYGYHDVTDNRDTAMQQPLCWITNAFDRSPAELLWAKTDRWGPLSGKLLNLSYGYGRMYVVPHEFSSGESGDDDADQATYRQPQGGMCQLPIPDLPTGMIRGRFSPLDGQLYLGGMFSWAGSRQEQEGGLFRVQYRGARADLPIELHAVDEGIDVTFSDPLDAAAASEVDRYRVKVWDLKRTRNYGSKHFNERELPVSSARLDQDQRTIQLTIPDLKPTWGMEIVCRLKGSDGREFRRVIHNTIHYTSPR